MAEEAAEAAVEISADTNDTKKAGAMKWVIILVGVLAVLAGAVGGTFYLMRDESAEAPAADVGDAAGAEGEGEGEGEAAAARLPDKAPRYKALEPVFTVSFQDGGRTHYLQAAIQVMAREENVIEAVTTHMPLLRNGILMRMSEVKLAEIATREGREALRRDLLQVVRDALARETQDADVEDLYFTSFVVQ